MEEALKRDIDSSLNDVSTWNTANQVYLHANMEVAETFPNIYSPSLVEVKRKKDKKLDKDKPMELEKHDNLNETVEKKLLRRLELNEVKFNPPPMPEQGVTPKFICERMKRKKSKSKWMKRKWKYKMLSNKVARENDGKKVLRMMLEHFRPWKGNKFKFKEVSPKEDKIDDTDKSDCASVTSSSTYKGMEEESGVYGSTSDLSSITDYASGNHDDKCIFLEEEVERLKN